MKDAFLPIHGYRMYIILIVVKFIAVLIGRCGKNQESLNKISCVSTHAILLVLLTDFLCELHSLFTNLGDNINDCKYFGVTTADRLFYNIDFPGWLFYIVMLVIILVVLMVECGPNLEPKSRKKSIGLVFMVSIGIVLANLLNSFSVYEYCGLECPGISAGLVELISGVVYGGDAYYLHYATNIVSLMAIPLYISIVNYVCVPRMELVKANYMVKFLKKINGVVFILFLMHFCRDVFLWLESFAYAPMVVCAFILELYLSKELK